MPTRRPETAIARMLREGTEQWEKSKTLLCETPDPTDILFGQAGDDAMAAACRT